MGSITGLFATIREHRLGYRLLAAIILASTGLALIATGIQLYADYRRDLSAIDSEFALIQRSHLESLANSLWTFNDVQIRLQIDGLLQLPDVRYVEVIAKSGQHFIAGEIPRGQVLSREFVLRNPTSGQRVLGLLKVTVALENVYQRLLDTALVIFVTQSVKTFFISLFILFILSRWITRPLEHLAKYARGLSLDRLGESVTLPRPPRSAPDELDEVAMALNDMSVTLASELRRRAAAETERERLFDAYEQNRRLLQSIIDNTTALITIKDLDGRHLLVNQRFRELFGVGREVLGLTDSEIFPADNAAAFRANDSRVLKLEEAGEYEETVSHYDGVHTYLSVKFPLRTTDGQVFAVCAISNDITERKKAEIELAGYKERLEQKVQERTTQLAMALNELEMFSYSVAHDLRAPLRAQDGFAKALAEDYGECLDDRGKDYLRRIRVSAQSMEQLIDDLLELARVTRADLKLTDNNLSEIVTEIIQTLKAAAPKRQVDIRIHPDLFAQCDAGLAHVALQNMLENAWKYTARCDVAVIEFGCNEVEGERVFFVRDNGAGFDMKYANRLFHAFTRLHHPDEFSGTGVGLATVHRIIAKHGGRIWANAAPLQGATFFFTFTGASSAIAD